jgi:hypothetical protein
LTGDTLTAILPFLFILRYIVPFVFVVWFLIKFLKLQQEKNQILKALSDKIDQLNNR